MMELNQYKKEVVNSFVNSLVRERGHQRVLILSHGEFEIFKDVASSHVDVFKYNDGLPAQGKWDLILADLPLGMKSHKYGNSISYLLGTLLEATSLVAKDGEIFSIAEPNLFRQDAKGIRTALNSTDLRVNAVFNAPEGFLKPYTELQTSFVLIGRGIESHEFIGELITIEQSSILASNFATDTTGGNLATGIHCEVGKFDGFSRWKVRQQINTLETEYKNFDTKRLRDFVRNVNTTKPSSEFSEINNCLYVHKVGSKPVVSKIADLSTKHNYYYQCVCDETLVDADYIASFFNSKLGKLIYQSLSTGSYVPNITTQSLLDAEVSIPPLETQIQISTSIKKLKKIREKIFSFENDLAVNPIGSDYTLKQIDSMLEVVGELAESDKIISLIREGESKSVEFKETLSLDVKKASKEKYIETSAIKTLAAFMNTSGGTLLVGVNDAGEVLGVDHEVEKFYKNSNDDFLLKFKNLIKERIGAEAYNFIDYRLVKMSGKQVLYVACKESPHPIYVDGNDFYVRANPATDKLDGPKMVIYIQNHFKH
jgi:hypothetical protein